MVCRMLGFEDAFGAMPTFGGGEGRVLISSVDCTGDEERLQDCALTFGSGNCTHGSDVGVSCIASGLTGSTPAQKRAAQVTVEGWMGQRHHRRKSVTRSWGLVSASSTGPTDCEIMDGVPLPFQQDMGEQAYVYFDKLQTR